MISKVENPRLDSLTTFGKLLGTELRVTHTSNSVLVLTR